MLRPRVIMLVTLGVSMLSLAAYFSTATVLANDTAIGEMGRSSTGSASSWNGTHTLVAWPDHRRTNSSALSDIYAARLDGTNTVVDQLGTGVSTANGLQSEPSIAFGSGVWLVVWQDTRAGGSSIDVYGARVSSAGVVLDPTGIAVASSPVPEQLPSVGYDGTRFLVAYQFTTADGGFAIAGASVLPDGTVPSTGFPLSNGPGNETAPATACTGGGQCLVAWQDTQNDVGDIYATRVSGTLPMDATGLKVATTAGAQISAASTFDGTLYVVVWDDRPAAGTYNITAARVQTDGTIVDSAGVVVTTSAAIKSEPAVGCRATECLLTWQESLSGINLRGARFQQSTGAVLDAPSVIYTNNSRRQLTPSVSAMATDYLVSYFDNTWPGNDNTRSRVVSASNGTTLPSLLSSLNRARQFNSGIGTNGTTTYVGWIERHNSLWTTWARRFRPDGLPAGAAFELDAEPSFVSGGTFLAPSFASDPGGTFLSAWSRRGQSTANYSVFIRRLGATGPLEDAGVMLSGLTADARGPSVAWAGAQFVLAWDDGSAGIRAIRGARVTSAGAVQDPAGLLLVSSSVDQVNPELACRSSGCLVVWADRRVAGAALMMALLDPATLTITNTQELDNLVDYEWFSLAASVDGYLVVWTNGTSSFDVRAARVQPDGTVLDPGGLRIAERGEQDYDPSVASDGTNFHVIWSHRVSGQGDETLGAKIRWDGSVNAVLGYPVIDAGIDDRIEARVALLGADSMLVSFTDFVEPSSYAWQIGVRAVIFVDDGGGRCRRRRRRGVRRGVDVRRRR